MKKYRIRYREYFSSEDKYLIVFAETSQDANDFFFKNYHGEILETEFIDWA